MFTGNTLRNDDRKPKGTLENVLDCTIIILTQIALAYILYRMI